DYFNSLVVGNTFRPIADQHKISRAKLAYIVDSIAAPVAVLAPLSSWGAYLISLFAITLAPYHWDELNALSLFLTIIPMNFYALSAIAMVCCVAYYQIDIGKMKQCEAAAYQRTESIKSATSNKESIQLQGSLYDLFLPIFILIAAMLIMMFYTGSLHLSQNYKPFSIFSAMTNAQVPLSLFVSAVAGLSIIIILLLKKNVKIHSIMMGMWTGFKSMYIGVSILVFGWLLSSVIHQVGTGIFLSQIINNTLSIHWVPALAFLSSCVISFSTGSSWAAFGIMIPISASIIFNSPDITLLIPTLAAAISGAVFGDHCSPISDTTILSSLASGCHHMEHFITQLPYSLICGVIALIGYITLGITASAWLAGLSCLLSFIAIIILLFVYYRHTLIIPSQSTPSLK
ncbi:MAG: hypothetical protein HAW67_05020, partial [Endozoicomonadaceae bacterium]|nr:hypothetical protein [Endozoicomonadaceae bacterium]